MGLVSGLLGGHRRVVAVSCVLVLGLGGGALADVSFGQSASTAWPQAAVDELPDSFPGRDVEVVAPDPNKPRWLRVSFYSPALEQRAVSVVILPRSYEADGDPFGTLYYLHGTSQTNFEPVQKELEEAFPNSYPYGPGRGYYVAANLDRPSQNYVTVVLDAGPRHWCPSCYWTDRITDKGVLAETHLYGELIPLVEHLFNVRRDRGGRAVAGHSMGGTGTMIQATRHPDRWGYAGSMSPSLIMTRPVVGAAMPWYAWLYYLRGQGHTPENEIGLRGVDPMELATNLSGHNTEMFIYMGDGCPANEPDNPCRSVPDQPHAGAAAAGWLFDVEGQYRLYLEAASAHLNRVGVPHHLVKRDGGHVDMADETYGTMMVDRINRVFERDVADPSVFSYKSVDSSFGIWGYQVEVERPNTEFLHLLSAHADGRGFILAGTGTASVTLPAAFKRNHAYRVIITAEDGTSVERTVTARGDGRLAITDIPLGPRRDIDERLTLVDAGEYLFPHTRVEILDAA